MLLFSAGCLIATLIAGHETTLHRVYAAIVLAEGQKDPASVDLLTERMQFHETALWMLVFLIDASRSDAPLSLVYPNLKEVIIMTTALRNWRSAPVTERFFQAWIATTMVLAAYIASVATFVNDTSLTLWLIGAPIAVAKVGLIGSGLGFLVWFVRIRKIDHSS